MITIGDSTGSANATLSGNGGVVFQNPITVASTNTGIATWTGTNGVFGGGSIDNAATGLFDCRNDGDGPGAAARQTKHRMTVRRLTGVLGSGKNYTIGYR